MSWFFLDRLLNVIRDGSSFPSIHSSLKIVFFYNTSTISQSKTGSLSLFSANNSVSIKSYFFLNSTSTKTPRTHKKYTLKLLVHIIPSFIGFQFSWFQFLLLNSTKHIENHKNFPTFSIMCMNSWWWW